MFSNLSFFSSIVLVGTLAYVVVSKRNTSKLLSDNLEVFNERINTSKKEMESLNQQIHDRSDLFQSMVGDGEISSEKFAELLREGKDSGDVGLLDLYDIHCVCAASKQGVSDKVFSIGQR